jgi:hypothetical protein
LDTVNNKDYILLVGDMNARVGNNKLFCLKWLIEKWREYNLEKHLLFVEYEKHLVLYKDRLYLIF